MWILQFFLGLLVANAGEWLMHRYLLHYCGKHSDSFWAYHWQEHHYVARQLDMVDPGYNKWPIRWNTQAKECLTLTSILLINLPFFWWMNGYACGLYLSVILYYLLHRQAHLNSRWAKAYLPWHYDHHMYDSNFNWCVTYPFFDYVMKTRRKRGSGW
jgi:hypothetical protein